MVAPGTIEAATAAIRVLIARLRLINSQLVDAEQQLDRLCKKILEPVAGDEGENTPGQISEQRDAAILDSTPGIGRTVLVSCSQRLQMLCRGGTIMLCGHYVVLPR